MKIQVATYPGTLSQAVKPELIRHLCRVHGILLK